MFLLQRLIARTFSEQYLQPGTISAVVPRGLTCLQASATRAMYPKYAKPDDLPFLIGRHVSSIARRASFLTVGVDAPAAAPSARKSPDRTRQSGALARRPFWHGLPARLRRTVVDCQWTFLQNS